MAEGIDDDEDGFAGEGTDFEEWDDELHAPGSEKFRPLFAAPDIAVDSLDEALEFDRNASGGHDAKSIALGSGQGIYGLMCVINYCRSMQLGGKSGEEIVNAVVVEQQPFRASDTPIERWMMPVNDEYDPLLQELLDSFEDFDDAGVPDVTSETMKDSSHGGALTTENASDLEKENHSRVEVRKHKFNDSRNQSEMPAAEDVQMISEVKKKRDESYFMSYNAIGIHREMLSDKSRMTFYRKAIQSCNLAGKVVLDVGAGTGIMSMLCARQGASKVIAVEAAPGTAELATKLAKSNHFNNIEVRSCKAEALDESDLQDVDVIVSEWMGYSLLYEAMLESVLRVRDRCSKSPIMLPSTATLLAALGSEEAVHNANFWKDVEGFDFSCAGELERRSCEESSPLVRVVPSSSIISDSATIRKWNLETMSISDQNFTRDLEFTIETNGIQSRARASCLVLWFTVGFPSTSDIELDTSPFVPATHWAQTVLPFPEDRTPVCDGQTIMVRLNLANGIPEDDHRGLAFAVQVASSKGDLDDAPTMSYAMT